MRASALRLASVSFRPTTAAEQVMADQDQLDVRGFGRAARNPSCPRRFQLRVISQVDQETRKLASPIRIRVNHDGTR